MRAFTLRVLTFGPFGAFRRMVYPIRAIGIPIGGSVSDVATEVLPDQPDRVDGVIQNTGAGDFYVSGDPGMAFGEGYLVKGGQTPPDRLAWPYSTPAYAICDAGQSSTYRGLAVH